MVLLKNGRYLSPEMWQFVEGDILIDKDSITAVGSELPSQETQVVDLKGKRVIPGFIDIHMHGAMGYDVMTASPEQIGIIARYLACSGTTSFFPTTITADIDDIIYGLRNIRTAAEHETRGASIEGVHVEGPYINERQRGCHDPSKIKKASIDEYYVLKQKVGKLRMHFTCAPEIEGAVEWVKHVCLEGNTVSIGHSDGLQEDVLKALDAGANIFTHLFNGMRGIHHREPGVAGTALASSAFVELICDGVHVHPAIVDLVYRIKGKDGMVLVTDAMHATGLGDGKYQFGGFTVNVVDGIARKEDGSLASSTLSLFKAVKNMMKFTGAPLEEAVKMASFNPAKAVGLDNVTGSIQPGKRADLVVLDEELQITSVYCRGEQIFS